MLNEHQINFLPERIAQRIDDINSEYLENIGSIINKIGELRPKDVHQLQRMYNYGADMEKVIAKLSSVSGKNAQEIYDIFNIVAKENYDYAEPFYKAQGMKFIPYEDNESLQRYVNSLAKQTVDEYINITQHTAFAVFSKDGKSIAPLFEANKNKLATSLSDTYTKIVDYAVTKVQLGEESYTKAMRDVIKAMASSGIKTVDYAIGYSRNLESAVRQNILWGVKQCNQNTADMIGEEFGADGYEIDYHSNPRPSHAEMGGRQYAKGPARTVKGVYYPSFEKEAEPLLNEYGCLHFKFSILLGISVPAYSKKQLAEYKARDKQTFEFEGHKYTAYEGKQLQGRIESAIKYQKDLANTAKKYGDDDLRREAQYNINVLTNKYAKLSEVSGLPTRMERLQVAGFKPVKAVDKSVKSGIIKEELTMASSRYLNKHDDLYKRAKKITPLNGYEDIICHGDSIGLVYRDADGKETNVSAKEFVAILKQDPNYKGGNIRLVSCETGAGEKSVAQYIANTLNVEVLAPTEKVFVDSDGKMIVTNSRSKAAQRVNTGYWKLFKPKGR